MKHKKNLVFLFVIVIALTYISGNLWLDNDTPQTSQKFYNEIPESLKIPEAISITRPESFSELYKKVKSAVVNISTAKEVKIQRMSPLNPFFRGFPDPFGMQGFREDQTKKENNSLGSGFIINKDGDILTNYHVIEGADEITVRLSDGRDFEAKVIGVDEKLDIAVIKTITKGDFDFVPLGDSNEIEVGDWVVALGNPFGLGQTLTSGIISAKARILGAGPYDDFIQTDASINPGNSGGPLFNTDGEVIGINSAIIATGQGLGFAIPINVVKEILPQLLTSGQVKRGWMGVAIRDVEKKEAQNAGLAQVQGAYLVDVVTGGPAHRAGIKANDIIIEFNNQGVDTSHKLPTLVARVMPGEKATVVFLRGKERHEKEIVLGSLDNPQASIQGGQSSSDLLGMSVRDLSDREASKLGGGVIVTDVKPNSLAASVGIRPGDYIREMNGQAVISVSDFANKIARLAKGSVIRVGLIRGANVYYFAFRKE